MAELSGFKVGDGTESGEFTPIAPGEYTMLMESAELKENSKGTGSYFAVKFQVLDGPYKGRLVFDNWTYQNQSEVAQNIGRGKITSLSKAVGFKEGQVVRDTNDLCNKPVIGVVKIQEGKGEYGDKNVIQAFKAVTKVAALSKKAAPTAAVEADEEEGAPWQA